MATFTINSSPGSVIQINLAITNIAGARANSITIPQITRVILPSFTTASNYPLNFIQLDIGLYYQKITLPTSSNGLGSFLLDISYSDPDTGLIKTDLWQVLSNSATGTASASPG